MFPCFKKGRGVKFLPMISDSERTRPERTLPLRVGFLLQHATADKELGTAREGNLPLGEAWALEAALGCGWEASPWYEYLETDMEEDTLHIPASKSSDKPAEDSPGVIAPYRIAPLANSTAFGIPNQEAGVPFIPILFLPQC